MFVAEEHTVAILGGGPRGKDHARAFMENSDRFEIVGVCDMDAERLGELHEICPETKSFANCSEMLGETKPDVFCFATLPHIRLDMIELGARFGVKAIAYEKPMATSLAEAKQMNDICEEAGIKTIVSHQHKYGDHWIKAKEIADGGEIGEVTLIHATAKGWLLQYGTHLADYMMFLNGGSRIKWVTGHVQGREKLSDSHPSPDYAIGRFEFENGVQGIMECGDLAPDFPGEMPFWHNAGATIYGTEGYARVCVGTGWTAVTKSSDGVIGEPGKFSVPHDQPLYIRDLAAWLDDPEHIHPCNGDVSHHGFQFVMGICLSSLERRRIDLPVDSTSPIMERLEKKL